jgi:hypothetical protein
MSTCSLEDVLKILNNNISNVNNVNPEGSGVNNLTYYNLSPEVRLLEAENKHYAPDRKFGIYKPEFGPTCFTEPGQLQAIILLKEI